MTHINCLYKPGSDILLWNLKHCQLIRQLFSRFDDNSQYIRWIKQFYCAKWRSIMCYVLSIATICYSSFAGEMNWIFSNRRDDAFQKVNFSPYVVLKKLRMKWLIQNYSISLRNFYGMHNFNFSFRSETVGKKFLIR